MANGPSAGGTPLAVPERGSLETSAAAVLTAKASDRAFFAMSMQISVEQLNGETLVLEVTPEMRMREVKQQIKDMQTWEDELSRDTTFVEVIFENKKLGNDEMVAEVGLSADSTVTAILRQNVARCSNKEGFGPEIDPDTLVIVEIPDSEIEIGDDAFGDCTAVAKVTIPSSVRHIGDFAFADCSALRIVTIADSVTHIGWGAFNGCRSLTSVNIPNSLTHIINGTYLACASLTRVAIPDSVTHIAESAFSSCTSLTSLEIPDSVRQIEQCAFDGCSQLTLRAPARLLSPSIGPGIRAMVAKECACGECDYRRFQNGWVCPKHAGS